MNIRGLVFIIIGFLCFIFFTAGVATPVVKIETNGFKSWSTLWKNCVEGPGMPEKCEDHKLEDDDCFVSDVKAARAFFIMSIICSITAIMLVGVLDFLSVQVPTIPLPWKTMGAMPKKAIMAGSAGAVCLFSLIAWAVVVGSFWNGECEGKSNADREGSSLGPCAPLAIVGWVLTILLIPAAFAAPTGEAETSGDHGNPFANAQSADAGPSFGAPGTTGARKDADIEL